MSNNNTPAKNRLLLLTAASAIFLSLCETEAAQEKTTGIKTRKNEEGMTLFITENPNFNCLTPTGWFIRNPHVSNLKRWEFSKENPDLPEGSPWKTGFTLEILENVTIRLGKTPEDFVKETLEQRKTRKGGIQNQNTREKGLPQGEGYKKTSFETRSEKTGFREYHKILWNNRLNILIMMRGQCKNEETHKWAPVFEQMEPF